MAVLTVVLLLPFGQGAVRADAGDYGYMDGTYSGTNSPTGEKPESKLWFNDGSWWASILDPVTRQYMIQRLDRGNQSWVSTGTVLDNRPDSRADILWDGRHLYVASHISSTSGGSSPARLYRYSYNGSTRAYQLSSGFPVTINNVASETLTIDRDSNGRLWASWTQAKSVYVSWTTTGDGAWSTPVVLPATGATGLGSDDISSVVAFGGNAVGVMWSNQAVSAMYFAVHRDADPATTWQTSRTAVQGPSSADDHINLKALQGDSQGRVFAAVKTNFDALKTSSAPQILVLARDAVTGDWASAAFGRVSDCHTRPVMLIDSSAQRLHVFATAPSDSSCPFSGSPGTIYAKSSPLQSMSFPLGKGTPVIRDASSPNMNNVTTTKQTVSSATGMVVLASDNVAKRYWHADLPLSATTEPTAPAASFTASATSGTAPLAVAFTDSSTGSPTSWAWTFGDGGTSTVRSPSHTFSTAGTFTVRLTASNSVGSSTATTTVTVTGSSLSTSFVSTADTYVKSDRPTGNWGGALMLRVRDVNSPVIRSYLRFNVTGLSGPAASVKLRLRVTDGSPDGGTVRAVSDNTWGELTTTWNNAPVFQAGGLGSAGPVTAATFVEIALQASAVPGNGTYSFALTTSSSDSAIFASRETATPPVLVVTQG